MTLQIDFTPESVQETSERLEKAAGICRSILAKTPGNLACLQLMGIIECKLKRPAASEIWFQKALAVEPDSPEILCGYGMALIMGKQFARAIPLLERASAIKSDFPLALHHLGQAYKENGNTAEAIQTYERLLTVKPDDVAILYNLALMAKDLDNLPQARAYCESAVDREPANPFCLNNLGVVCYMMGDYDEAAASFKKALELHPDYPEALSNLSILMHESGAFDQALDYSSRAVALRPDYPEGLNNLGVALKDLGRLEEAIEVFRRALRLRETDPETQYNLSLALLSTGKFEEGWRLHEARWKTRFLKQSHRRYSQPLWDGRAAQGRVLFIHQEQGLGDTLQFCRYAPMAAELGLRVVLEVQPPLLGLMKSLKNVETVLAPPQEPEAFDFHCPMMSLPLALRTQEHAIPAEIPYVSADEKEVEKWRNRLASLVSAKPRVGLVWAGSARLHTPSLAMTDRRRSISPDMLRRLSDNEKIHCFSLQKEGPKAPKTMGLIDLMDECRDFADTAALLANLDLVITVDTAVAHLAGALGKPVWVMNRFDSCWRWRRQIETTPWYPTMRLFHQPKAGDWTSVISRIAAELAVFLSR